MKKNWYKKNLGPKKSVVGKIFGPTKYLGLEKNVEAKKICAKNLGLEKILWLKFFLGKIFFGAEIINHVSKCMDTVLVLGYG